METPPKNVRPWFAFSSALQKATRRSSWISTDFNAYPEICHSFVEMLWSDGLVCRMLGAFGAAVLLLCGNSGTIGHLHGGGKDGIWIIESAGINHSTLGVLKLMLEIACHQWRTMFSVWPEVSDHCRFSAAPCDLILKRHWASVPVTLRGHGVWGWTPWEDFPGNLQGQNWLTQIWG